GGQGLQLVQRFIGVAGTKGVVVAGPSPTIRRTASVSLAPSQCTCFPKWVTNDPAGMGTTRVRIKIGSAAHPPCSRQHGDEAIVRVKVRSAEMMAGEPLRHDAVQTRLCRIAEQDGLLVAVRGDRAPVVGSLKTTAFGSSSPAEDIIVKPSRSVAANAADCARWPPFMFSSRPLCLSWGRQVATLRRRVQSLRHWADP